MEFNEFEVLSALAEGLAAPDDREALMSIETAGLIAEGHVTEAGFAALEPYRVRRAVVLAAGFGSRLVPITLNTPKPLVRVMGERMVDSVLDAVYAAGIEEVYLVRGYRGEQFDQLLYKYPDLRFVENPMFGESNNISSLVAARYLLSGSYVIEGDLLVRNPSVVRRYQYRSNYLAIPMERSDDWCFHVSDGIIERVSVGGEGEVWQMVGLSFWTEADGRKLVDDLPAVMAEPGGRERYWDEVPLTYRADRYEVAVRECTREDIVEIDTYRELQALDSAYA